MNHENYRHLLLKLDEQIESLQIQKELGILSSVDAADEEAMIRDKQLKTKKKLVDAVHISAKGKPIAISVHAEPTASYPEGYVYTRTKEGRTIKARDIDSLYCRLYDFYYSTDESCIIKDVFEKALEAKTVFKNPKNETLRKNRYDFERYFDDDFKSKDIREITDYDLQTYCYNLVHGDKPIRDHQFKDFKGILNLIFGYALKHKIIGDNPVDTIDNMVYLKSCEYHHSQPDEKILTPEEIERLIEETKARADKKYYIYHYALFFSSLTGVRVGELCAFKWADVHFADKELHIHSQLIYERPDGHLVYHIVPYTKDERGIPKGGRRFPMTIKIESLLHELADVQKREGISSEFVFCHEDGSYITSKEYTSFLAKLCKKHNLAVTNNHALRMSLNSNVLIPLGLTPTDRAKLLGHSVETNIKHYSFARKDYLDNARDILDSADREQTGSEKVHDYTLPFKQRKNPQTANL